MNSQPRLIMIVGLQKSGTTVLGRLLLQTGLVDKPFKGEGDDFWGNVPQFSPTAFPAGTCYQAYQGKRGHELGGEDATPDIKSAMRQRFLDLETQCSVIFNKSPYNTVRLPWIRQIFPDSIIVATIRNPVANTFSLFKKFIPHDNSGLSPEDGWWGVRPSGWQDLVVPDKLTQCAYQWKAVNSKLAMDRQYVDLVIGYHHLCSNPNYWIEAILSLAAGQATSLRSPLQPLQCFDNEYEIGSRLQSKNRYWKQVKSLTIPDGEPIEIKSLSTEETQTIKGICASTAAKFDELKDEPLD